MAQLKDLIVTGIARFANKINGDITGDARSVGGHDTPTSGDASTTQVVLGNDTRLTNSRTPTSHTHGNVQNGGTISSTAVTPANTDYILMSDTSNSGKIERGIAIGTDTTKYLRNDGTWVKPTDNNTTYTFAEGSTNGAFSVTPSGSSAQSVPVHGLEDLAFKDDIDSTYIKPLSTKTYTGLIGSSNDAAGASFYFGTIMPTGGYYDIWKIHFKITAVAAGNNNAKGYFDCWITGTQSSMMTYHNYNTVVNNSYRTIYYTNLYRATSAGITGGYGHLLGIDIHNGWNPTTSANSRTITVEILETISCTYTPWDTALKYASVPGTGSTNYSGLSQMDAYTNGLRETGDDNTYAYNIGWNNYSGKTSSNIGIWQGGLAMLDSSDKLMSICTASDGTATSSNRTTATTKKANIYGFKVGSTIFYINQSYNPNVNISDASKVLSQYGTAFDSRYAFNTTLTAGSLTTYTPIYLVGTINSTDGLFYLDTTWWTQTPNDSSKIYIYVGRCFDSTTSNCRIVLDQDNKWYIYNGSKLIEYQSNTTYYGYCLSAGNDSYKDVNIYTTTVPDTAIALTTDSFILRVGTIIFVRFTYWNTASKVYLNVSGTGYKQVLGTSQQSNLYYETRNNLCSPLSLNCFVYTGSYWQFVSSSLDTYSLYDGSVNLLDPSNSSGVLIVADETGGYRRTATAQCINILYPILFSETSENYDVSPNVPGIYRTKRRISGLLLSISLMNMTPYAPIFVTGTLSGTVFTFSASNFAGSVTQTIPTSEDNLLYMRLGMAISTTILTLDEDHRIYKYQNGAFSLYNG